jgi:hypothetical protein
MGFGCICGYFRIHTYQSFKQISPNFMLKSSNIATKVLNNDMAKRYEAAWQKIYSQMNEQMQALIIRNKGQEHIHPDVKKFIKDVINLAESDSII